MAAGDRLAEWTGDLADFLEEFGEPVSWQAAGEEAVEITAIIQRATRGRAATEAGDSSIATGTIAIRWSDLPAAAQRDLVTLPVTPGSSETEAYIVGEQTADHDNGMVSFAMTRETDHRYTDRRLES